MWANWNPSRSWWECTVVQHPCQTVWHLLRKLELPCDSVCIYIQTVYTYTYVYMYIWNLKRICKQDLRKYLLPVFTAALLTTAKRRKQPTVSTNRWTSKQNVVLPIQLNIIQPQKGNKFCLMLQYAWALRILCQANKPVTKIQIIFHLWEISRVLRFFETEGRMLGQCVAQVVNLPLEILVSRIKIHMWVLASLFPIQLPANMPEKAAHGGPGAWASVTHLGDPDDFSLV